jgi:hypothetical protein
MGEDAEGSIVPAAGAAGACAAGAGRQEATGTAAQAFIGRPDRCSVCRRDWVSFPLRLRRPNECQLRVPKNLSSLRSSDEVIRHGARLSLHVLCKTEELLSNRLSISSLAVQTDQTQQTFPLLRQG